MEKRNESVGHKKSVQGVEFAGQSLDLDTMLRHAKENEAATEKRLRERAASASSSELAHLVRDYNQATYYVGKVMQAYRVMDNLVNKMFV